MPEHGVEARLFGSGGLSQPIASEADFCVLLAAGVLWIAALARAIVLLRKR